MRLIAFAGYHIDTLPALPPLEFIAVFLDSIVPPRWNRSHSTAKIAAETISVSTSQRVMRGRDPPYYRPHRTPTATDISAAIMAV
jgi:hypothetical protein